MAIDRCIAIMTPLKAGKIRVSLITKLNKFIFVNRYSIYADVRGLWLVYFQHRIYLYFICVSMVQLDIVPPYSTVNQLLQDVVFI